jgi:hypothetical protein
MVAIQSFLGTIYSFLGAIPSPFKVHRTLASYGFER